MTGLEAFFLGSAAAGSSAAAAASSILATAPAAAIGASSAAALGAAGSAAALGAGTAAAGMSTMGTIGTIASLAGTGLSALSSIQQGKALEASGKNAAEQARIVASNAAAVGQREAAVQRRASNYALSRSRALAAASGGGAADPSVVGNEQDLAEQGEMNVLTALFNGSSRSDQYLRQATVSEWEGKQSKRSGFVKAGTTIFDGMGTSLYRKYGSNPVVEGA